MLLSSFVECDATAQRGLFAYSNDMQARAVSVGAVIGLLQLTGQIRESNDQWMRARSARPIRPRTSKPNVVSGPLMPAPPSVPSDDDRPGRVHGHVQSLSVQRHVQPER